MKNLIIVFIAIFLVGLQVSAQMPASGATCIGCHGANGMSPNPLWPNLAGQKADYISKQLNAFKAGTRQDSMMNPLAQSLSEKDIAELSQYFSKMGSK